MKRPLVQIYMVKEGTVLSVSLVFSEVSVEVIGYIQCMDSMASFQFAFILCLVFN